MRPTVTTARFNITSAGALILLKMLLLLLLNVKLMGEALRLKDEKFSILQHSQFGLLTFSSRAKVTI